MISIIHPSRGRSRQSFETISKWILKAGADDFEVLVGVEWEDYEEYVKVYFPNSGQSCNPPPDKIRDKISICPGHYGSAVAAINSVARMHAKGRIFIVVSDDTEPCVRWASRIEKYTAGLTDFVLKTRDGIQPKMINMPILDRAYYQRDGYIYHPEFSHCWADRYFTEIAHKRGRVITKNIMFRHLHYSALKKKPDAQYQRTDATFNQGKIIYKKLMAGL